VFPVFSHFLLRHFAERIVVVDLAECTIQAGRGLALSKQAIKGSAVESIHREVIQPEFRFYGSAFSPFSLSALAVRPDLTAARSSANGLNHAGASSLLLACSFSWLAGGGVDFVDAFFLGCRLLCR
jgi:hypothetical protein